VLIEFPENDLLYCVSVYFELPSIKQ